MSIMVRTSTTQEMPEDVNHNFFLYKNVFYTATNIFFVCNKAPERLTYLINAPLRVISSIFAYQKREYWKIALDVASFAALILYGRNAAIAVDVTAVAAPLVYKQIELWNRGEQLDPLMVLGVETDQAKDSEFINERYKKLMGELEKRKKNVEKSPVLKNKLEEMIRNVENAFQSLKSV